MSLSELVQDSFVVEPVRIMVHGPEKIGKSTFAAGAPEVIFLDTEGGLKYIRTRKLPRIKSYSDIVNYLGVLYSEEHQYQSLCIDSVDWLEKLIWEEVCRTNGDVKSIEQIGYGKGYKFAMQYWDELIEGLEALRKNRNMNIILIAHSEIKRFDDPLEDSYDRYRIQLHKSASAKIQQWVDVIGFANFLMSIKKENIGFDKKKVRAQTIGLRKLFMNKSAAYDAGCRIAGMPDSIDLSYAAFQQALNNARNQ